MRIGLFGGSFNPVHNDHVAICEQFKKCAKLDKIFVIPAAVSPFKNGYGVKDDNRLQMLSLAFKDHSDITICDYEIKNGGKSYTYLTVEHFKSLYPNDELFFLVGADSLCTFLTWKNPERILNCVTLVVAGRKGYDYTFSLAEFKQKTNKEVLQIEFEGKISSSLVRELLMLGVKPTNYLNPKVIDYIFKNNLYKGDKYYNFVSSRLKEGRLIHTAGVILTAKNLAKKLGQSEQEAALSALLHDLAKYEKASDFPNLQMPSETPESVVHQYIGAHIAQTELKITNQNVLNAIRYHTTGRANMSELEKIVFIADLLEPFRTYSEAEELRKAVDKDFNNGFKLCLERLIKHLKKSQSNIFYLTLEAYEYYKNN